MGRNNTPDSRACVLIAMSLCLTLGVAHCTRNNGGQESSQSTTRIIGGRTTTSSMDPVVITTERSVRPIVLSSAFTNERMVISDENGRPPEKMPSTTSSTNHILLDLLAQQLKDYSVLDDSMWNVERYRRRSLKSIDSLSPLDNDDITDMQMDEEENDEDEDDEDDDVQELEADDDDTSAVEIKPIFDKRAFCQPRRHPVNVPQPEDPTLIFQPMCIQVERCGGCCAHELFECVPLVIKNATRKVVALRYPHSGAEYFVFEAVAKVQIERHTKCKCQCKMQPEDCSTNQIYDRQNCQCVCEQQNGHLKCKAPQVWSDKECRCRCPEFSECSTGTYFDTRMCRCRAAGEILAQSKLFKSHLRRLYH